MSYIKIHQDKAENKAEIVKICPFSAIELKEDTLSINAACRLCKMCVNKGNGVFEFVEENVLPAADKNLWKGIAVVAEINENGIIHPVTYELLGKARELADKVNYPVYALVMGYQVMNAAEKLLHYGTDTVFVYDAPELKYFRIEPYVNVLEHFINKQKPSSILVGGTINGRSLAPRAAARLRTGLTADCTVLDISENTDLDQIRPAYGGNIMAHITTPNHRPQFATVRYKVFNAPEMTEPHGKAVICSVPKEKMQSKIDILNIESKQIRQNIEDAEVLVVAGRGIKRKEDISLLQELAALLNGKVAATRAVVEAGWIKPECQIGLSGRTVKPKLIITCGVSGAIQFLSGMKNSELIVAVNSDPDAPIFKTAHVGLVGDLYTIVPEMIQQLKAK